MPSTWFLQDTTNNAGVSKSKRFFPFHILPLSLSSTSDSHASTRKSPPICTLSLEHATCSSSMDTSMDVSMVPFPSSEAASIDSQPDIECRPHKLRRFSQDTTSLGVQVVRQQSKRRRSASSSRRHSLLSSPPNTCLSSPLRTRSASFSHSRQLTMRETTDLRFIAMIRKSVLSGSGDCMNVDQDSDLRDQDNILVQRLEQYLLERGYREFLGEPPRASILLSSQQPIVGVTRGFGEFDETFSVPCVSPGLTPVIHSRPQIPSRSQVIATLILRHRSRMSSRRRLHFGDSGSPNQRPVSPLVRHASF